MAYHDDDDAAEARHDTLVGMAAAIAFVLFFAILLFAVVHGARYGCDPPFTTEPAAERVEHEDFCGACGR